MAKLAKTLFTPTQWWLASGAYPELIADASVRLVWGRLRRYYRLFRRQADVSQANRPQHAVIVRNGLHTL
jgi:hypothetical protein